jgi:IS605 OrfB family transposase
MKRKLSLTLKIPISRPIFDDTIEDVYAQVAGLERKQQYRSITNAWKEWERENHQNPWNAAQWKTCLFEVAKCVQKQYNLRVADLVREIAAGKTFNVLQSYGRSIPESCPDTLPAPIREGIGDKFASNTKDLFKGQKKPPYSKASWIRINRNKKYPFQFEQIGGRFVVVLDVGHFEKNGKWPTLAPSKRKANLYRHPFLLDLRSRQKSGNWDVKGSYENHIAKLVSGEFKSNCCELVLTRSGWQANFFVEIETDIKERDPDSVVGVDIGIRNPVVLAGNGKEKFSIWNNEYDHMQRLRHKHLRQMSTNKASARFGKGQKNKFRHRKPATEKQDLRREAWIKRCAARVARWVGCSNAGTVQMEDLSRMRDTRHIRFPFRRLQEQIEWDLKKIGIPVRYVDPAYTSQRCSACGYINTDYNYKFRTDKKNWERGKPPGFVCSGCSFGTKRYVDGDYNAAMNLRLSDLNKSIKRQLKVQGLIPDIEVVL